MNSNQKIFLLHYYFKYGLYMMWFGVSRQHFCNAFEFYFLPLLPASDNEEILQRAETYEMIFLKKLVGGEVL